MTIRTFGNDVQYWPVQFGLFRKVEHGKDKGKVDRASYVTITLHRRVSGGPVESVGDTIKRLREMLDPGTFFQIMNAKETEQERISRYEAQGLEIINNVKSLKPITPINDDELVAADTGRPKAKRKAA